jgi:hypothetical protein
MNLEDEKMFKIAFDSISKSNATLSETVNGLMASLSDMYENYNSLMGEYQSLTEKINKSPEEKDKIILELQETNLYLEDMLLAGQKLDKKLDSPEGNEGTNLG